MIYFNLETEKKENKRNKGIIFLIDYIHLFSKSLHF